MTTVTTSTLQAVRATAHKRPLLEVENLEVVYGRSVTAIQGVSLGVSHGSITGIVGTNGAGKSTTLAAIAGFLSADDVKITDGRIAFNGDSIVRKPPHYVARRGVGFVPERAKIFSRLTVDENLQASVRASDVIDLARVYDLFPVLYERRRQVSGYLSGGERQMLAMAMALLGAPKLVMVDEMSLGLAPTIVRGLAKVVRQLRDLGGITFLLVEQNALLAVELCDYIYVMENGRVVFDGRPDKLVEHADFREFYLGMGHGEDGRSYRDIKEYRRRRRWFG